MRAGDERTYARAVLPWMRPDARPVRRGVQLLVGLVLYAASIAMLVDAGLGSMPWDVLTQGIVRRTDLSFGVVTLLTGLVVLACWIPLRQRPGVGTVANVVVISALVDPFLALLDGLPDALRRRASRWPPSGIVLNGLATRPVRRCPARAGSARRAHDRARRAGPAAPCGWSAPASR